MSSPRSKRNSSSSTVGRKSTSPERPRLTEQEKKTNHIASEQKRRAAIREQFDRLATMTPGMAGQGRSEGKVLEEMLKYAHDQMDHRERLIKEVEASGGTVTKEDRNLF